MYLVLIEDGRVDERLTKTYRALDDMKNNINFCNKAIRELIDPITNSKNRIRVHKNYNDYNNVMELATLLRSNNTREMFKTIQEDLHKKLNGISMNEVRDLLDRDLQAHNIEELTTNIENLLSKRRKAKKEEEHPLIINFYEDSTWVGTL